MSDDYIKRFNLSEKPPGKSFNRSANAVRDKDNTQPQPPKPRFVSLEHPRLAPPGMMGARLANDARKWMESKRQEREAEKPFKPLVQRSGKDRGPSR